MKKIFILTLIFFSTQQLFAQVEITPYYGWLWTGSVPMFNSYPPFYSGESAKVDDKANYGARLGVVLPNEMIVEFEWNHTKTNFIYRNTASEQKSIPFTANYYLLGFVKEVELNSDVLIPFGVFNIGMVNFRNTDNEDYTQNLFTVGFGGGLKYFFNEKLGIRLQARILAPMQAAGVSMGCGIGTGGGGCGTGVSAFSSIIQGDFTGGIVLKLGQ